jgi:hypothetical protein
LTTTTITTTATKYLIQGFRYVDIPLDLPPHHNINTSVNMALNVILVFKVIHTTVAGLVMRLIDVIASMRKKKMMKVNVVALTSRRKTKPRILVDFAWSMTI